MPCRERESSLISIEGNIHFDLEGKVRMKMKSLRHAEDARMTIFHVQDASFNPLKRIPFFMYV